MNSSTFQLRSRVCHGRIGRAFRRGFTFTEVMFAVILLGIGFIMLAGMFPVAIQQTQTNVEESTASTVVRAAARYLEESMTQDDMPATGDFTAPVAYPRFLRVSQRFDKVAEPMPPHLILDPALWQKCRGGFILPQDPRFAWTALYKRNPGDNFAQVIIFALQARNQTTYLPVDLEPLNIGLGIDLASFEPRFLEAILSDGQDPATPDIIEFPGAGANGILRDAVAEGCFVVVGSDNIAADVPATPQFDPGSGNGRIYRIGQRRADLDNTNASGTFAWELMPGHDMASPEENLPMRGTPYAALSAGNYNDHVTGGGAVPATVYIVGRGFEAPGVPNFSGFAQDIAVYSTSIRLR